MYPSTKIAFNISPNSLIGKLYIDDKYYAGEIFDGDVDDPALKFEAGKEFSENILTDNIFKTGSNWFGLPNLESIIDGIDELYPDNNVPSSRKGDIDMTYIDYSE